VALLLVDVINEFAFPEAPALLRRALPMARALKRLKQRAKGAGVPIVYVNDNFGRWRSDFNAIVRHCARRDGRGRHVVQLLRPEADDYFVLKPKHSGFYESSLGVLLDHLGVRRLIVTGLTTPQCVLFTAGDAYMRDFELVVPRDCVAATDARQHRQALTFMSRFFAADTRPSTHRALRRLRRR
jgi:nicotinamidase-related amidase